MYSQKWRLYRVDTEQKQDIRKATVTTSRGNTTRGEPINKTTHTLFEVKENIVVNSTSLNLVEVRKGYTRVERKQCERISTRVNTAVMKTCYIIVFLDTSNLLNSDGVRCQVAGQ